VLSSAPKEVIAILRSAQSQTPDPRVDDVLEAFRRHWLVIAQKKYPALQQDVEDAIQNALLKLLSPARLEKLKDINKLEAWARSIFIHAVMDVIRDDRARQRRRVYLTRHREDPEDVLRDHVPAEGPTPEESAEQRERLRIVARCIEGLEVARLKFVDGLPDDEIAARRSLTRAAVEGQLKRFRKRVRSLLGDAQ
jgi:RNA polymerase sigma factor (sigma-70 family)